MPATLDRLSSDFHSTTNRYRSLEELIANEEREPTELEQGELDSMADRLRSLRPRIEEAAELERSLAAGSTALANLPAMPIDGRAGPPQRSA